MSSSKRLSELLALQRIVEVKHRGEVAAAQEQVSARNKENAKLRKAALQCAAEMERIFTSQTLCPDQMRMAACKLSLADADAAEGHRKLLSAQSAEQAARSSWRKANMRAEQLANRHHAERKAENARAERQKMEELLSLRAALKEAS